MSTREDPVLNPRVMGILDRLLVAWGGDQPFKNDDSRDVAVAMSLSLLMFADNSGGTPKLTESIFRGIAKRYRRELKAQLDKHPRRT